MSRRAELVGGPADGTIVAVPDRPPPTWEIMVTGNVLASFDDRGEQVTPVKTATYRMRIYSATLKYDFIERI